MQLDRTAIVIRERGMMEILDLALHVTRLFLPQLLVLFVIGCLPFLILNRFALGPLIEIDPRDYSREEYSLRMVRYVVGMSVVVMLQAPLATSLMTAWLGHAVFSQRPPIREAIRETRSVAGRLLWCQGILRGSLVATAIAFLANSDSRETIELPLLLLLGFIIGIVRAIRPFINEIVLLEKNPLTSGGSPQTMTIGKRNTALHAAGAGTLFFQFLGSGMIAGMLTLALFYTLLFFQGVLLNRWTTNTGMLLYALPISLWVVSLLMTVFRFLCYLDLRIRQEGWAVELRLRAEAARLNLQVNVQ